MHSNFNDCQDLAAALGFDPCYLVDIAHPFRRLSAAEHAFVFAQAHCDAIAFYSSVSDLLFSQGYLRYEFRGRGPCIVFHTSLVTLTREQALGVLIHELAHYISDRRPERDDTDHARALTAWWSAPPLANGGHTRDWLTATVHLAIRAEACGYGDMLSHALPDRGKRYGFGQTHVDAILHDAVTRRREPLGDILRKQAAAKPKSKPKPTDVVDWSFIGGHTVVIRGDGSRTIDGKRVGDAEFRSALIQPRKVATTVGSRAALMM